MKRPKGITRRNFMKRGAALASLAVAGGPLVLARGAERQPAKPKKPHKRERRTLHFDFSPSQGGIQDLRLIALRSESHQAVLKVHTAESRQRFRKENQVLGAIPDANLTHYLEEVDLPADALQFLQVVGTDAATGQALWLGGHLHMPSKTLSAFAKRAAREGRLTLFHTKLQAYNSPLPSLSSAAGVAAALVNAADFVGP